MSRSPLSALMQNVIDSHQGLSFAAVAAEMDDGELWWAAFDMQLEVQKAGSPAAAPEAARRAAAITKEIESRGPGFIPRAFALVAPHLSEEQLVAILDHGRNKLGERGLPKEHRAATEKYITQCSAELARRAALR